MVLAGLASALPTAGVAAQAAQTGQRATAYAARAEPRPGTRILMLRPGGNVPARASAAETALTRALAERGFSVTSSPLPFHDAQLVAGCAGTLRECGSQVARALESEHLAVALIEEAGSAPGAQLALFVFESGGAVREGATQLPAAPDAPLEPAVSALVARMFDLAPPRASLVTAPVADAVVPDAPRNGQQPRVLRTVGWITLGAGSALLVGALATSVAAESASQAYAESDVQSRAEADRALAHYETAQRRADAAHVLWGVGAGTVAAAAFMLLWQRFEPPDRNLQNSQNSRRTSGGGRTALRVTALPARAGVSFALRGEL